MLEAAAWGQPAAQYAFLEAARDLPVLGFDMTAFDS
jgi:hypothetical protein